MLIVFQVSVTYPPANDERRIIILLFHCKGSVVLRIRTCVFCQNICKIGHFSLEGEYAKSDICQPMSPYQIRKWQCHLTIKIILSEIKTDNLTAKYVWHNHCLLVCRKRKAYKRMLNKKRNYLI